LRIEGNDLHTVVAVSPWEAALGGRVPVQTVDGSVTLAIPKGSQNGRKLRLRGKGLPRPNGVWGDLIVELVIKIPDHLTHDEEKLFREMSKKSLFNPRDSYQQMAGSYEEVQG